MLRIHLTKDLPCDYVENYLPNLYFTMALIMLYEKSATLMSLRNYFGRMPGSRLGSWVFVAHRRKLKAWI